MKLNVFIICILSLLGSCSGQEKNSSQSHEGKNREELEIKFVDYEIINSDKKLVYSSSEKDFATVKFSTNFPEGTKVIVRKQLPANTVDDEVLKQSFLVDTLAVSNAEIHVSLSHKFTPSFLIFDIYIEHQDKTIQKLMQEQKDYHREFQVDYAKEKLNGTNSGEVLIPLGLHIK